MRKPKLPVLVTTCLLALSAGGCNVSMITDAVLLFSIAPQVFVVIGSNQIVNPGQAAQLDASSTVIVLGNGQVAAPTQANLAFTWVIEQAFDRATNQPIDVGGTGATLTNANTTNPTFMSPTSADYTIRCTASNGLLTGSNITGVRVN